MFKFLKNIMTSQTKSDFAYLPERASASLAVGSELTRLKREAVRIVKSQSIDAHLFTLFEEIKAFSVMPQNVISAAWQYPFLSIENVEIKVIQTEHGGVVMKFITANLLNHKICLGFGVFPKSESDFRYSTNALQLAIDDEKYISATYVVHYSEKGRNWRLTDIEEFHNRPDAEPLLRQFSELVEQHRVDSNSQIENEQIEANQKKFSF